ncbi:MAG: hypothetical protein U0792_17900 [Gemmataceae bacterium]
MPNLDNGHRATAGNALCCEQEVHHELHMLSASKLPAHELQLHSTRHLPRVFEVPEALFLRR